MSLDDEFQQLRDLEIGNVERAIREIEDAKSAIQEVSNKINSVSEDYMGLFKQKLKKAIDNVFAMESLIFDEQIEIPKYKNEIEGIYRNRKKHNLISIDYPIFIGFNFLDGATSLYENIMPNNMTKIILKKQITSKNSSEFVEKLAYGVDEKYLLKLLILTSEIPQKVLDKSLVKKRELTNKLESLKKNLKKIEELSVTDF